MLIFWRVSVIFQHIEMTVNNYTYAVKELIAVIKGISVKKRKKRQHHEGLSSLLSSLCGRNFWMLTAGTDSLGGQ